MSISTPSAPSTDVSTGTSTLTLDADAFPAGYKFYLVAITLASGSVQDWGDFDEDDSFIEQYNGTRGNLRLVIATRRHRMDDPSDWTVTLSGSVGACMFVTTFSGGVGSDPFDTELEIDNIEISSGFGTQLGADLAPTENDALRMLIGCGDSTGTTALTHTQAGGTERVDIGNSNRLQLWAYYDGPHATPSAATGDSFATPLCSTGSYDALMLLFYLKSGVAPTIEEIEPAFGPITGGDTIIITGTGFKSGNTEVYIDDVACTGVSVLASTQLACVTPAGTVGDKSVQVDTDEGTAFEA